MSKLLWRRSVVYSSKSWNRVKEMKRICGSSQIIITLRFDLTLHLQQHLSFRRWAFAICRWVCVFVYIWIDTHSFYPPLAPALSLSMNGIYAEAYTLHIAHIKSSDIRVNISRLTPENNFPSEIVHPHSLNNSNNNKTRRLIFHLFFPLSLNSHASFGYVFINCDAVFIIDSQLHCHYLLRARITHTHFISHYCGRTGNCKLSPLAKEMELKCNRHAGNKY